jgi:hypothetical protein
MTRNWKSPLYWQRITEEVRGLADERTGSSFRGGIGFVPRYRSTRQIAAVLNERGCRTRQGKKFSPQTVQLLLKKTKANPEPLSENELEETRTRLARAMSNGAGSILFYLPTRVNGPKRFYKYRREIKSMDDITLDMVSLIHTQILELEEFRHLPERALLNEFDKFMEAEGQ